MTAEIVTYQADHPLLLAVPAFAPAIVVAGVVAYIAIRDRRRKDPPKDQPAGTRDGVHSERGGVASEDDSP
ncbi:hypothetical protein [Mycolicibacterium smegmatis]|uniref:hypothetical protein n=1 Tax=Mycolicibacterium smegmatis TaxID=1772 RepID=UPI0013034612|nr:hypothetical protein [Mycolicibacterium smegmatis]